MKRYPGTAVLRNRCDRNYFLSGISLFETHFAQNDAPFTINKNYAKRLREKRSTFRDLSGTKKYLRFVFISPYGLTENGYSQELVPQSISVAELYE